MCFMFHLNNAPLCIQKKKQLISAQIKQDDFVGEQHGVIVNISGCCSVGLRFKFKLIF